MRVFPGIEGAQKHMNSRWELVKMLVMQDMLAQKPTDSSHHKGPAIDCQRCTIRNDVITTFWGLPKKVDQSIEFGLTHVRAGIIGPLLDEVAIMLLAPTVRSSMSVRRIRALNAHLANVLRQYAAESESPESMPPASDAGSGDEPSDAVAANGGTQQAAAEAHEQVHRMFFQLHEILSKLRLEHVGIALRVTELVFDLPLAPAAPARSLPVCAPGMLRWRQRNIEVGAGYLWGAITSAAQSTVGGGRLAASSGGWPGDTGFVRRSQDSTAFVRVASGTVQALALRTPSMTPDRRAEELDAQAAGFRLRHCTLFGEMSAFLSEDLTHRPSPQPLFSLDIGRPELVLDLKTQLAFDEAKAWIAHIGHRARAMRRILSQDKRETRGIMSFRMNALVSLMFADVKAHVAVERALYAVRPHVSATAQEENLQCVALRMQHLECHLSWSLDALGRRCGERGSSSSLDSFVTGAGSDACLERNDDPLLDAAAGSDASAGDALRPTIQFRLSTSPIGAQWEDTAPESASTPLPPQSQGQQQQSKRQILIAKCGVRARGLVNLHIGATSAAATDTDSKPRINADIEADVGDVGGMLREYDFRHWLSMQPLWLATQLMHIAGTEYKIPESSKPDDSELAPVGERRRAAAATLRIAFDSLRMSVLACDNEEDVLSGIEHGTQVCLAAGALCVRLNGGSIESPHVFGLRPDIGPMTVNLECQRVTMFLLSAVPAYSAQPADENPKQTQCGVEDFVVSDLCGYGADSVQRHIVLMQPKLGIGSRHLAQGRSRTVYDLETVAFTATTGVRSVYRWSVFMSHVKYWLRRKKLGRRMAMQQVDEPEESSNDVLVSIRSALLDLHGDLVLPAYFNLDQGLAQCIGANMTAEEGRQSPEMRLKIPEVQFTIEKTQQSTEGDMVIKLGGPLVTMYGSSTPKGQLKRLAMQPLMSMKQCQMAMRFPCKAKKQALGAAQGVRSNGTYSKIDIVFERAAMAFGHRYNMAETIDGYLLLQKACKRIARKSITTCYPPPPHSETWVAGTKPVVTAKSLMTALGNPRHFVPPPLRSLSTVAAPPPPTLTEPDDVPTIDFHGPEFTIMVHDDPFETALARIYQVGSHEQRERLSRLEAFETKAEELQTRREREFVLTETIAKGKRAHRDNAAGSAKHARSRTSHKPTSSSGGGGSSSGRASKGAKGAGTFSGSFERLPVSQSQQQHRRPPMIAGARTFASSNSRNDLPPPAPRGLVSLSMHDVSKVTQMPEHEGRVRSYTTVSQESLDESDDGYEDIDDPAESAPSQHQRMVDLVAADIAAAHNRLMLVESREWVRAIRRKMQPQPEQPQGGSEAGSAEGMYFSEIFDMPRASSHCEQPGQLPHNYVPGSWTHPPAPLCRLVMSPVWLRLDTPLSLLEFNQIEAYLRYLDPATPHNLKWATLVPMRLRIKCGDIRMQLRDFPFPLFRVPDPYRHETQPREEMCTSYEDFYGGVEISGSLLIAERVAHERSLRSIYIPIGPRSSQSGIELPTVGWYLCKSLQFPRVFATMSIMMFSAPSHAPPADLQSPQRTHLQARLPPLPIMSAWGASYQPVISALMQRLESVTSKSADVSPSLPWWDKLRSRMHFKCRMAVIDAPLRPCIANQQQKQQAPASPDVDNLYLNIPTNEQQQQQQPPLGSERGQMFFLALDGRDPYQVTQKPGSYLFTMRGGVRICLNEGFPGSDLWDKESGRGIYSVPTEEGAPPSAALGEFMRLRCEEFLMGVPIIIDRQSAILKSMDSQRPESTDMTPTLEEINQMMDQGGESLLWKRAYADLLHSIGSDNSARYTFVTQSMDRLYFKVLLHLSGGVRLGIGLSSYIPPDPAGVRHNHWEVQPIAPESARAAALLGTTDAYTGYRSSKLHTSISLLCPFTDSKADIKASSGQQQQAAAKQRAFADMYLSSEPAGTRECAAQSQTLLRLRAPDASVLKKPPRKWTAYDTDSLVSPMHSLFATTLQSHPPLSSSSSAAAAGADTHSRRSPKAQDLFFVPFPSLCQDTASPHASASTLPAAFAAKARPSPTAATAAAAAASAAAGRSNSKPQCQISASAAAIEGTQRYLPLYVSRMMLPVRKGSLYPFTETSDNKLGKCLRSMRLVLDLKNVELAYSQRDFEIKELETREMGMMGYNNEYLDIGLSPTPSDMSAQGAAALGAKVEGTVRELKARVDSFSFNLLLEQSSVKLTVGSKSDAASDKDGVSSSSSSGNGVDYKRSSRVQSNPPADTSAQKPRRKAEGPKVAATETMALRWGVGDASTEIDYLDVRLTQMAFCMPLFANPLAPELLRGARVNGLRFADGALSGLSEFERSWISCTSIRDLKELDISEATFTSPSVVCVLWSPRMVYFTQRPGWTQFGDKLDEILDNGGAKVSESVESQQQQQQQQGVPVSPVLAGFDNAVAGAQADLGAEPVVYRGLGAPRGRALSDVKHAARLTARTYSGTAASNMPLAKNRTDDSVGAGSALHRRNTSMPWALSRNLSHDSIIYDAPTGSRPPPVPTAATTQGYISSQHSFFGNIQPAAVFMQRASTQPTSGNLLLQQQQQQQQQHRQPSEVGSTGPSPQLQPLIPAVPAHQSTVDAPGVESSSDLKSPTSAMSYKSSFHLLELARSRQRRLTASNSRQSINPSLPSPSQQPQPESPLNYAPVDIQRQPSLAIEPALTNIQMVRLVPTGPDPNVIMRDSRTTQAMLLRKRKLMLGTAIQQEQAGLAHLSREFERASNRHSDEFRKEMIRRAEHIYELGARRKLINRCLRFLGVDPDIDGSPGNAPQELPVTAAMEEIDVDFDRDTQEVEKVLATLYRHRCLIYSGYLIWTSQVRDELMRFLYIQDCLTAIEYYLSETATKVVRTATSAKYTGDSGSVPSETLARDTCEVVGRDCSESTVTAGSETAGVDNGAGSGPLLAVPKERPSRPRRQSADQSSVNSGSSRLSGGLHIPNLLRKLRSHDKLKDDAVNSKTTQDSSGLGFLWRSKKSKQKKQQQKHQRQQQDKSKAGKQKTKERCKEDYKLSKRSVGRNKFDKGLKSVWDDFIRYRPYYSILVEFLNSQVSMRVDENSTTSAIAVAERVQLHRILLCNEDELDNALAHGEDTLLDSGATFMRPPDDESIVKTRSLVELENVQVFTAKRNDFEHQAAYFVDCTYGSQTEGDASQPSAIWPAWIPIELLLSQGKHRARGIFDELAEADAAMSGSKDDSGSSDSDGDFTLDGRGQTRSNSRKRSKAWWLEDLSKYKRLMDRNNGLVVYDKANPHRIQGDSTRKVASDMNLAAMDAENTEVRGSAERPNTSGGMSGDGDYDGDKAKEDGECDSSDDSNDDNDDSNEFIANEADGVANDGNSGGGATSNNNNSGGNAGSGQGLSHRANHFSVFLPELNLACTAEQYTAVYETVTELLVFIDPEKAAYMDHLNTILLGMDMDDLRGLLTVISATQEALRERLPIIQDWYTIQRSHVVLLRDAGRTAAADIDAGLQKSRAMSLLTLDRHRRALELQLRTAMDLFGTAQKQMRQHKRLDARAAATATNTNSNAGGSAHHQEGSPAFNGGDTATSSVPAQAQSRRQTVSSAPTKAAAADADQGPSTGLPPRLRSRANTAQSSGNAMRSSVHSGRNRGDAASTTSVSSMSSSSCMQSSEGAQTTIARTIHLFISKATWHMLENDGQPLCDVTLRWATLKAVTTSDQATHLLSEVHLLYIVNRLPNPMFTDLVGPYVRPKHPRPDFCVEKMIRVRWSELAPVGGISIVERFEVDLFPLRLQLSHDIAQKLINYLYPPQDSANTNGGGGGPSNSSSHTDMASGVARNRRPTVSSISSGEVASANIPIAAGSSMPSTPSTAISAGAGATTMSAGPYGSSLSMLGDMQGSGRSLLATRMIRRNPTEESVRSSPTFEDRLPRSHLHMSQLSPQSPQPVSAGLLATMSGRNTPFSMFSDNTSMINISQSSDNRNQVDQMKKRASSNKTFLNIKIGGSTLCISYQGKKTNNITDLRDFEFHAPRLELRNQVESYYELLMQVKKEYMSVVVQHTGALVKEKFRQLHSRKAWSKSSFGPDWEARRLLIEMDRRVDEDMAASVHNIISEREGTPGSVAMQQRGFSDSKDNTGPGYLQPLDQYRIPSVQVSEPILEDASGSASAQAAGNHSMALDGTIDDAASIHSAKGKAPLSKHMILDPRKLMGKRVPNLSRNPTVRSNTAEPAVGSGSQQVSQPTSIPSAGFRGPTYSAMHLDMVPAAPFALSMPGSGSGSAGEAGNERRPSAAASQDSAKQKDGSSSSSDQQQQ
ncbi:hypothetical protein BX661DRAFT_185375 [Kickxella alabastrina]|uniref:uncharacterized protein n=1 Tax=Kickxella alabastrina TaxID=61397 RepID=UPI00221E6935|nr:uncharacterized protein BX661DRAFT_185375 [Kickxella alabastrina]KAI7824474.1 hypothetical protein BX661DRAFT_185375 [Kickxella alabastrina]